MTWPAPTSPPTPPPWPPSPPQLDRGDDRRRTARPIAAWLAATGGSLVLVAAIVAVAGNWQDIAAWIKLAGLLTISATVVVGAERTRSSLPATSRAMAHLGAALAAPVGVAAAAMAGQVWPICVLAGGVLGAVACDVQARRWRAPLLDAATIVAIGLALTGVAALVPVPVGMLGAVAGLALLVARRETAAATFALAGAASPVLVALAERRVGPGTLDRIGATGDVLTWSAPLAGVLAGLVLAVVATRRDAAPLAVAALGAPVIGIVTGLGSVDVDVAVWASLPGLVLVALEAVAALTRTGPWRRVTTPAADVLATGMAAIALGAPAIVLAADAIAGDVPVLPIVLAAAGLAMSARRRAGRDGDVLTAGAGSLVVAGALALGSPVLGAAAVAAAVAIAAVAARRPTVVPAVVAGGWGVALVVAARPAGNAAASTLAVAIAVALMTAALELRLARSTDDGQPLDVVTAAIAVGGALLAASCCAAGRPAVLVAVLSISVVHVVFRRPTRAPALLAAATFVSGYTALAVVVGDSGRATVDTSFGLGLLALAGAATATWWRAGVSWAAHAATVIAVTAVPFGLAAIGAGSGEVAIALMTLAVVLTGWAFVTIRVTPMASAGVAAGTLAAAVAYSGDHPLLVSLAITVVGVQGALHGATRRSPELAWSGVALAAVGTVSTWFTSGANDAVIDWLRPYGVTTGDVAVAALAGLLFAAGALAGRRFDCSSWLTAGPGLGLVGGWLLSTEIARDVRWSLPLLLVAGLLAVGIGGVHRLAAPLVLGTAMIATTVTVAAGPRLADLDTWVWLAVGGAGLIALAVLVERTVNGDEGDGVDWRRLRQTWR